MSNADATSEQIAFWDSYSAGLMLRRSDILLDLWHEQGVLRLVFPMLGGPAEIPGPDYARSLADFFGMVEHMAVETLFIESVGPAVFYVCFATTLRLAGRAPFTNQVLGRVTLKDGKALSIDEYVDTLRYAEFIASLRPPADESGRNDGQSD